MILLICCADSSRHMTVFCQSILDFICHHGITIFIIILMCGQEIINLLKCMNTIIIICIDHRKRTADRIDTTEDRMAGTKRFHSSFRHFKSFRKIGKFLVYIGDLHNFTHAVSDTLSEVCLIFFFYDKYNFLKSCSFCIINRKIHNDVSLCIDRIDLL